MAVKRRYGPSLEDGHTLAQLLEFEWSFGHLYLDQDVTRLTQATSMPPT